MLMLSRAAIFFNLFFFDEIGCEKNEILLKNVTFLYFLLRMGHTFKIN